MDDETATVLISAESILPGSSSLLSFLPTISLSVTSMVFSRALVSSSLLSGVQTDTVDEISTSFDRMLTPLDSSLLLCIV